jgi:hypothetical protein
MKRAAAMSYASTYDTLVKKLCAGSLLHIDETTINCRGVHRYVWILASFEDVAYFYTPTREGNTVQELLRGFSGVLVSDFYSVYDSIDCRQQECLINLIRDLNSAILDRPFDDALQRFAKQFATLMISIIKTIEHTASRGDFLDGIAKPLTTSTNSFQRMGRASLPTRSSNGYKETGISCLPSWSSTMSHGVTTMRSTR